MSDTPPHRVTYRAVLGVREFRALLLSQGLSVLGDQVTRIALALLVFERSGSALAASATYACSFLTWIVGGPVLSALADRYERRRVMVTCDLLRVPLVVALALADLPLWAVFALLVPIAVLEPPFDSARSALLADVLTGDVYVAGNSLMTTMVQAGQVLGFLAGGALVSLLSYHGALLVDAGSFLVSAVVLLLLVRARPLDRADATASSLLTDVREGFFLVARNARLRWLLGQALLSCAVVIAPEGLAVAVAADLGGSHFTAGLLTASLPLGFLAGSVLLLRVPQERRLGLLPALTVLACLPLLLTPLLSAVPLVVLLWVLAGAGNALQIVASAEYVRSAPAEARGRAVGLAGTALMGVQGIVLVLAGGAADVFGARPAVALAGALGLLLLVPLTLGAPRERSLVQADLAGSRGTT